MSEAVEEIQDIFDKNPRLKEDVTYLKVWLEKQKHLPFVSDLQLVTFLNSCNNSLEATKACIDIYFTAKCGSPEFFSKRDPLGEDIKTVCQLTQLATLNYRSPEGYRYIFCRISNPDVSRYEPDAAIKLLFMIMDATLRHSAMAPGIVLVYDMKGVQFQHVTKASPTSLKKYMLYVQEAMPVKLKEMHIINASSLVSKIMLVVGPFMDKAHLKLLHFYTPENIAEFHKFVPQKYMPKEYGGEEGTVEELTKKTQQLLLSNRDWLLADEERCKVDESKREGKIRDDGDLFGQAGSFKKLSID